MMYPCKEEGPFIMQFFHEGNSIDWLEIKKGGVDPVFALQDIEKDNSITLQLGEQYNNKK